MSSKEGEEGLRTRLSCNIDIQWYCKLLNDMNVVCYVKEFSSWYMACNWEMDTLMF